LNYKADELREFRVYGYEWIDNLHFVQPVASVLAGSQDAAESYLRVASERFKDAGWKGDGDIGLIWLPPFVFPLDLKIPPEGIVLWHVKQSDDGVSFLLSPVALPFEEFRA
jgi:hypothetical protein